MKKRLASVLLCFFLCVTLFPAAAKATETAAVNVPEIPTEGDVWDGVSTTAPSEIVQKDGKNYYALRTGAQLAYIAQEGGTWLSKNYLLMNDIILNDVVFAWDADGNFITDTSFLAEWPMIGDEDSSFDGVFDGNGHSISGVWIDYSDDSAEYWGLFTSVGENGEIHNLTLKNSDIRSTGRFVGGIVGRLFGTITNCTNFASVTACGTAYWSGRDAGGIVGLCDGVIKNCTNNGPISGRYGVGGIAGSLSCGSVTDSINNGTITGIGENSWGNYVGGITGDGSVEKCLNTGVVIGNQFVGGIIGKGTASVCANHGVVAGTSSVGGIAGKSTKISNSYNLSNITGISGVGGIVGEGDGATVSFCYSSGNVLGIVEDSINIGAIVGTDGAVWGSDIAEGCYYLKTATVNTQIYGCGNADLIGEDPDGFYGICEEDFIKQETFIGWDFWEIWRISEKRNSGYPHLAWESANDPAPMTGIVVNPNTIELSSGDYAFLSATPKPENAIISKLSWSSNNTNVACVNSNGKVTAVSPGTAIIIATTDGYTATCTVTVTARISEEYKINSITIRDNDGAALSTIPIGTSLATVSITNLASEGNTLVYLAAYTSTGQYQGMMWVSVEDLPVDATIKVTLPVDNSDGKIANLKAFTVASFSNITPLGEAVSFLP